MTILCVRTNSLITIGEVYRLPRFELVRLVDVCSQQSLSVRKQEIMTKCPMSNTNMIEKCLGVGHGICVTPLHDLHQWHNCKFIFFMVQRNTVNMIHAYIQAVVSKEWQINEWHTKDLFLHTDQYVRRHFVITSLDNAAKQIRRMSKKQYFKYAWKRYNETAIIVPQNYPIQDGEPFFVEYQVLESCHLYQPTCSSHYPI